MRDFRKKIKRLERLTDAMSVVQGHYDFKDLWGVRLGQDELVAAWRRSVDERASGAAHVPFYLYVHVPYCMSKCLFCRYGSVALDEPGRLAEYVEGFRAEADVFAGALEGVVFRSVYVGGGTPNLLDDALFAELLKIIGDRFEIDAAGVSTCEMIPGLVTESKAAAAAGFGFRRVSLGVQSCDADVLKRVKRYGATGEQVREDIAMLHAAGIGMVNVDLMVFLPGDTETGFRECVREMCECGPETVNLYNYIGDEKLIEPERQAGTDWRRMVDIFEEESAPAGYVVEPTERDNPFSCLVKKKGVDLASAMSGYRYEMISRNARSVLGLGPLAVSSAFGTAHYRNDGPPPAGRAYRGLFVTPDTESRSQIILHACRRAALDRGEFRRVFGADAVALFPDEFGYLESSKKAHVTRDAVEWRFADEYDASVHSKLFFENEVVVKLEKKYGVADEKMKVTLAVTLKSDPRVVWIFEAVEDDGASRGLMRAGGLVLLHTVDAGQAPGAEEALEKFNLTAPDVPEVVASIFELVMNDKKRHSPGSAIRRVASLLREDIAAIDNRLSCRVERTGCRG